MAAQEHASSNGGTTVAKLPEPQMSMTERKQRLAEVLVTKTAQGYRIESQTDTDATIMMQGRRRWFGLVGSSTENRQITSIDEQGRARTRAL